MTAYKFGDVVLVPFPFTDQSDGKQRPAVVISSARYQQERPDLILMPITSQVAAALRFGELLVSDTQRAGLLLPSVIKPLIFSIEARLVRKSLGQMVDVDQHALRRNVLTLIG